MFAGTFIIKNCIKVILYSSVFTFLSLVIVCNCLSKDFFITFIHISHIKNVFMQSTMINVFLCPYNTHSSIIMFSMNFRSAMSRYTYTVIYFIHVSFLI